MAIVQDDTCAFHNGLRITNWDVLGMITRTSLDMTLDDQLDYDMRTKVVDGHIFDILDSVNAHRFRSITLSECAGITDATLVRIADKCKALTKLYVRDCDLITDDGIKVIVETFGKSLRVFSYNNCRKCTDAALQLIADHCPNLEYIYAQNTGISKIPHDLLQRLPCLYYANFSENKIKTVPPSIALLDGIEMDVYLGIDDNPLEDPPLCIVDEGTGALFKYFQENGTLPSGISEPPDYSIFQYFHKEAPESAPVPAPVPAAEEKSSPQKSKRKYDDDTMIYECALYNDFRLDNWEIDRHNIGGHFLNLSNLEDCDRRQLVDGHIIDLLDNLLCADEVKYIDLSGCVGITDATLVHIANNCTRLMRLWVNKCDKITDDGIETIVEKMGNNLTHLSYNNTNCTKTAFESILDHCPNLGTLGAENTGITKIPHNIQLRLPSLSYANFDNNEIESIPPSIALLDGTKADLFLRIDGNPLEDPPLCIVNEGPNAIYEYFQDDGTLPSGISEPPEYSIFQFIMDVPVSEEISSLQEPKREYGSKMEDGTTMYGARDFVDAIFENDELRLSTLEFDFKRRLTDNIVIDMILNNYVRNNDNLNTIDLSGCVGITDATLEYIACNQFVSLKTLIVDNCYKVTNVGIEAIAMMAGKRLRHLSYSNCTKCTDAAFQSIIENCPNLVTLGADNTGISKIPHDIRARLRRLNSLNLENNEIKVFPPSFLKGITGTGTFHNGLRLTHLDIKNAITFTGTMLEFNFLDDDTKTKVVDGHIFDIINKHVDAHELKDIDLDGCGVTDATLVQIANNCKSLTRFWVTNCDQITDDGIKAIVEQIGKNLEILSYDDCNKCTNAALQSIVDHCPNLDRLYARNAGVSKVPHDIGQRLPKLEDLDLSKNDIKTLPPSIANVVEILIDENPLEDPPLSIVEEGQNAILKYFEDNGTLPSSKTEPPNHSPERSPVLAPVPVSEEKSSSLQERKRKYVVEIDHQLFDPEDFDGINVLHSLEKDPEKNADENKPTTPAKRRKGMFELIGETTISFIEGLLGKN